MSLQTGRSPLNLLQEQQVGLPYSPWRVAMVCALMNRTFGRPIQATVDKFFELFDQPEIVADMTAAERTELMHLLKPLGFYEKRMAAITSISRDYVADKPIEQCCGCGQHVIDSVKIILYDMLDHATQDADLRKYVTWRKEQVRLAAIARQAQRNARWSK